MDLKQSMNDIARERAKNEQVQELAEDEEVTIDFLPEIDDLRYWIQRELQYSPGYISQDPELRRLQIYWTIELLKIEQLEEIATELENIVETMRQIHNET
jgi:hypothetical protein